MNLQVIFLISLLPVNIGSLVAILCYRKPGEPEWKNLARRKLINMNHE